MSFPLSCYGRMTLKKSSTSTEFLQSSPGNHALPLYLDVIILYNRTATVTVWACILIFCDYS